LSSPADCAESGSALIACRASVATLNGGGGNDTVPGGDTDDELLGRAGDDTLRGGTGDDSLDCGVDTDERTGDEGVDTAANCEVASSVP
jgi:Ca2+-binding RTX toxin-like protein